MKVMELRDLLANMPGEMSVYNVKGEGIGSAKHIFRANLIGVEQFCEIITFFEDHTPDFQDTLIERETGFKTRRELLDDHARLKKACAELLAAKEDQP